MPNIRIGFSSDFTLKNNIVGLGTTTGSGGRLDVDGVSKADYKITGVATLTSYGGFVAQKQHVNEPSTIGFATVGLQTAGVTTTFQYYETEIGFTDLGGVHHGDDQYFNTLSEDLVIDDGQILNITNTDMVGVTTLGEYDPHTHASYVCAGSLEQVSVTGHFSVPNGGTNDRQETPIEGTVRFNTDLNTLEFFNGVEWRQFTYNQGQSGRGVFANGRVGSTPYSTIDMITIPSLGNAVDFGESTQNAISPAGVGNGTRGIFAGGYAPAPGTTIEYVTMASQGNAISFGSITPAGRRFMAPAASSTRGVFFGGRLNPTSAQTAEIKYIEMGTLGNTEDFGNLSGGADMRGAAASSPTRGIYTTGTQVAPSGDNRNEYVTIASKSNSVEFGDLTVGRQYQAASSNSVRMVIGGGAPLVNPGGDKTMDYITIASLGNAIDFGNLTVGRYSFSSVSTQTRAVWAGGSDGSTDNYNVLDYVEISTLGDAMEFGDLTEGRYGTAAASDSHGGLGGF